MLEKSVEEYLRDQVKKELNGKCIKVETSSETGWPDRLIILPGGLIYFVETKRPKGGIFSRRQKYVISQLRELGCQVRGIKSKDEVDAFIEEAKDALHSA